MSCLVKLTLRSPSLDPKALAVPSPTVPILRSCQGVVSVTAVGLVNLALLDQQVFWWSFTRLVNDNSINVECMNTVLTHRINFGKRLCDRPENKFLSLQFKGFSDRTSCRLLGSGCVHHPSALACPSPASECPSSPTGQTALHLFFQAPLLQEVFFSQPLTGMTSGFAHQPS